MYQPVATILAGPNGAGKSTLLEEFKRDLEPLTVFVLPDEGAKAYQAQGYSVRKANVQSARDAIRVLRELRRSPRSFLHETTLADGPWPKMLRTLRSSGFRVEVVFVALPVAELAVERVNLRVQMGGHSVAPDRVRRRWAMGLANFFEDCWELADVWQFFDNGGAGITRVAAGRTSLDLEVFDRDIWHSYLRVAAAMGVASGLVDPTLDDIA